MATALRAYRLHFADVDPETPEGLKAFGFCLKKVRAILN